VCVTGMSGSGRRIDGETKQMSEEGEGEGEGKKEGKKVQGTNRAVQGTYRISAVDTSHKRLLNILYQ